VVTGTPVDLRTVRSQSARLYQVYAPFVRDIWIIRCSWKADIPGAIGTSSLPTSKDDACVDAPEAESIRNRMLYRHAPGLTGDEVDAFRGRIAIFKIESGRRDLVA
jgi:hypothetical protein